LNGLTPYTTPLSRSRPPRGPFTFVVLGVAMMHAAQAEEGDGLKVYATESVRHESNLFRLSSSIDRQSVIGRSSAAETIATTVAGLKYDKSYSLQRVELDVNFANYHYENFSYLGVNALNYRGALHWSATPAFYGNLSASRDKSPNSFSDFQSYRQNNERVEVNTRFDATYELDARWRVLGGVFEQSLTNKQPSIVENGIKQTTAEGGVRYVFPSGSFATLTLRAADGSYTDIPLSTSSLFDDSFTQRESEAAFFWIYSPKATVDLKLGYRSRSHPHFPQRDFSGPIGSARLNWNITAKTSLTAAWLHDINTYQSASTNFTRLDRFSLGPVWRISPKVTATVLFERSLRDYGGSPGLATPTDRNDNTSDTSIALGWRPYRNTSFNASLQNSRRGSSQPGLDYNNNTITLGAQFSF
jgi:exopolysaccharide biosynthesis operon protein EpsL